MNEINHRFKEEVGGLVSEALSPYIHISWDPLTDGARISFETARYLRSGEQYITKMHTDLEFLEIDKQEVATRSYEINGKVIDGNDVDMYIRTLFDELYNEKFGEEQELGDN